MYGWHKRNDRVVDNLLIVLVRVTLSLAPPVTTSQVSPGHFTSDPLAEDLVHITSDRFTNVTLNFPLALCIYFTLTFIYFPLISTVATAKAT